MFMLNCRMYVTHFQQHQIFSKNVTEGTVDAFLINGCFQVRDLLVAQYRDWECVRFTFDKTAKLSGDVAR